MKLVQVYEVLVLHVCNEPNVYFFSYGMELGKWETPLNCVHANIVIYLACLQNKPVRVPMKINY